MLYHLDPLLFRFQTSTFMRVLSLSLVLRGEIITKHIQAKVNPNRRCTLLLQHMRNVQPISRYNRHVHERDMYRVHDERERSERVTFNRTAGTTDTCTKATCTGFKMKERGASARCGG